MTTVTDSKMKHARLKREVREVVENCRLQNSIIDREVQFNFSGEKDNEGNFLAEKEVDVVVKFTYSGKKILLLFECEDSAGAKGVKRAYREYDTDIRIMQENLSGLHVLHSADQILQSRHFRDVDLIRACFVYGPSFPESALETCQKDARRYGFLVWSHLALLYYRRISSILGHWTRYELFKDFALELENVPTFTLKAMEVKQKGKTMYLAKIHPGQLLKIGYVVRRASEKKYAYQRMLSKDRINAIAEFISSTNPQAFLPNAVIAVFDSDERVRNVLQYDAEKHDLTVPNLYCSAWIIDGQHRAYGFLGTVYEEWSHERFEPFDLPIILFRDLSDVVQTQTFININYYQKRIKSGLLCDLTTLTKDLQHRLTWPSLIGRQLNDTIHSPLRNRVKVSELHGGRSIGLSSLVQYGLLETLLGYRSRVGTYSGPLCKYAPFDRSADFDSSSNQRAFHRQVSLLDRYLVGVRKNTAVDDKQTDPWSNTRDYSLLRPTGLNALFLVLAKILQKHPDAGLDFDQFLIPLRSVSFKSEYIAKKGGGWKGFRAFANTIIRKLNKGKKDRLTLYGEKDKL
jgi:DNA sulfur modification protein DndB